MDRCGRMHVPVGSGERQVALAWAGAGVGEGPGPRLGGSTVASMDKRQFLWLVLVPSKQRRGTELDKTKSFPCSVIWHITLHYIRLGRMKINARAAMASAWLFGLPGICARRFFRSGERAGDAWPRLSLGLQFAA